MNAAHRETAAAPEYSADLSEELSAALNNEAVDPAEELAAPEAQDGLSDRPRDPMNESIARWRAGLIKLAGESSLADIGLLGDAVIDLSAAHPSGVAQLFAGRPTRLSNLVREVGALPTARRRARAVASHSAELAQRYGVSPTYLAIGVATWTERPAPDSDKNDMEVITRVLGTPRQEGALNGTDVAVRNEGSGTAPSEPITTSLGASNPTMGSAGDNAENREPRVVRAPVLLRPVMLTPHSDVEGDYDITLDPTAEINPVVARTLRAHGALLDPTALAKATFTLAGFNPTDVLDRVASLGSAVLGDFELDRSVLVGTFVHPGQVLIDDLDELGPELERHEVVSALAGMDQAVNRLGKVELPEPRVGDADPAHERGVGDLDPNQRRVVDALATGSHLMVDAPVGSDVAGTLSAVVAEANASGRSVLYVPGHRRAADALAARLKSLGLDGLLLDIAPVPTWRESTSRRLLEAMAPVRERIDADEVARVRDALIGSRAQLAGYIEALHQMRDPWQVSAYDALQALARLTSERPAPATRVRLGSEPVITLDAERRAELAATLERAAELGAFTLSSSSSPWFGAHILTDDEASAALSRITRLVERTLPELGQQIEYVAGVTGLVTATTVRQWGEQLTMLGGMRGTLDVFQPMVFERTAADMVQATASRRQRADQSVDMGWLMRRRLKRRAREMVRPGVRVPDMHAALVEVQRQREVWQAQCPRGGWPTLPEGLASVEETYEAVRIDLEALEPVLGPSQAGGDLLDLDLGALLSRLTALVEAKTALEQLPERTTLLRYLRQVGLSELVDDLGKRRVEANLVGQELELSWWSSVFEQILAEEPDLAGQDGAGLDALAERFRDLDRRHVASLSVPVRAAVRAHLGAAMRDEREDAEALYTELVNGGLTSMRDLVSAHDSTLRRLRPTWVSTPTMVPHLLPAVCSADLVILDAVQHIPVEVVIPALARGRQVVVIGDPRSASGTAVRDLARLLPRVELQAEPARRDPKLTGLLAQHGYEGVLRPAPMPRTEALVHFSLVDGTGMPDPVSGTVESTSAEVERVVDLAIEHAMIRPDESFGIVTVTSTHADRIRERLLVEVRANPALAPFFAGSRSEPVVVADITGAAGLARDTIVLTLGFGRTPHGRVLHRFGVLSNGGGEAMLLGALGAARKRLHMVSCFPASDLDAERLRGPGPQMLARLLAFTEERSGIADQVEIGNGVDVARSVDRLVVDLGERLWRSGLVVETNYGLPDGDRIPLAVGHPDLPGELLVAVLTDDAAYVAEPSIRVRDRQLAEQLERLGWVVAQVWSAAAFLDPDTEAERVRRVVMSVRDARVGVIGSVEPAVPQVLGD